MLILQMIMWHLLEDVFGWVAILMVSIITMVRDIHLLDPALSLLIAVYILWKAGKNSKKILMIFLQRVPESVYPSSIHSLYSFFAIKITDTTGKRIKYYCVENILYEEILWMNTITREELKEMIDKKEDFVLINVLSENSFRMGHIKGSINVPIEDLNFEQKVADKIPIKDKKIVAYCASFECAASPEAAGKLIKMGYKNVYDFEGGIKDWQEGGYPIEKS